MINIRRRAAKQVVIIGGGFQNNKSTARLVKLPRAASTHKITSRCRVICHISWMLRARSNISSCMLQKQTIQLLLLRTAFIASHTRRHKDELLLLVCVHFALLKAALLSQQTSCEIGLWVFFRSYPADGYWESAAMRWWACFLCAALHAKALLAAMRRTVCHLSVIYSWLRLPCRDLQRYSGW